MGLDWQELVQKAADPPGAELFRSKDGDVFRVAGILHDHAHPCCDRWSLHLRVWLVFPEF